MASLEAFFDLLILDRGYPSYEVFEELHRRGIDFVIRMPLNACWPGLDEFVASEESERSITLPLRGTRQGKAGMVRPVRAIKCERPEKEPIVLFTSLSENIARLDDFAELYHLRWAVEETYKRPKGLYLNQRQMHSMSVVGVEQEILALHLFISLSRAMRGLAAEQKEIDHRDLSQKAAILATGRALAALALAPLLFQAAAWIKVRVRTLERIARRVVPRRPDRQSPRRSYQPWPRWGANGRVRTSK